MVKTLQISYCLEDSQIGSILVSMYFIFASVTYEIIDL